MEISFFVFHGWNVIVGWSYDGLNAAMVGDGSIGSVGRDVPTKIIT